MDVSMSDTIIGGENERAAAYLYMASRQSADKVSGFAARGHSAMTPIHCDPDQTCMRLAGIISLQVLSLRM